MSRSTRGPTKNARKVVQDPFSDDSGEDEREERTEKRPVKTNQRKTTKAPQTQKKPAAKKTAAPKQTRQEPEQAGASSSDHPNFWKCDLCSMSGVFPPNKIQRHKLSHADEAQAQCPLCKTFVKHKYNLKTHMMTCREEWSRRADMEAQQKYAPFYEALEAAAQDPSIPMPKFEDFNMPFTMDSMGFVSGFDDTLDVEPFKMMPTYKSDTIAVFGNNDDKYDEDEDDDDDEDDYEDADDEEDDYAGTV